MAIECKNCAYYYREFDSESLRFTEEYPQCHFVDMFPGDLAPCEYPDTEPEDDFHYPEFDE